MSDHECNEARRGRFVDRVAVLCLDNVLFSDLPVQKLAKMLEEIKAVVVKYTPDPPRAAKP